MATREVVTTFRHTPTGKSYRVKYNAEYGWTAKQATDYLASQGIGAKLAQVLGVQEHEVNWSVSARTELSEGLMRIPSDKKSSTGTGTGTGVKQAKVDPEARARELALGYVQEHPNTTFAAALKLAQAQVAREALEAQANKLSQDILDAEARIAELKGQRTEVLRQLNVLKGKGKPAPQEPATK